MSVKWQRHGFNGASKTVTLNRNGHFRFPEFTTDNYAITSDPSVEYNCIAWAAGDQENWWWPHEDSYWPDGVPREETLGAFIQAYARLGYSPCIESSVEAGYEKIAIYANADGPTHAARQLPNGGWTSKLGPDEDITHNSLAALNCQLYGRPVLYLKRPIRGGS
ncbi:DUF7689 domain-containing protein [Candidatus Binatus sp.]|uniref:DUF7689 domain-containing protein n=1 Tax=Candidatus Binatus sp. TaxID=2811406 RepID=UPI003C76ACA3